MLSDLANRLLSACHARTVPQFDDLDEADAYQRNGGGSGLVVGRKRLVGSSEFGVIVTDWSVDTALVKELREC
jgi:hypothetical protein